ncbi:MAG: hypothetical protein K2N09_04640 [Muribaculaceae bacterium]|nr:hypothetical protein [Muribaculaceae bacterium]
MKTYTTKNCFFRLAMPLLSCLFAGAFSMSAQKTYLPILEIGKSWTYINYAVSGELHEPAVPWTWEAISAAEEDGHQAFTLLYNNGSGSGREFTQSEYEEDGVLWSYSEDDCMYQPMIDFKMEVGDLIGYNEVIWKGAVDIEGVERCVIAIKNSWNGKLCYWIEGIGAIDDIYLSPVIMAIGERTRMTECRMGDKCLFDINRMDEYMSGIDLSGVKSLTSLQEDTHIYDILGRRIASPAPGQLYIQGGKKHIAK